MVAKKRPARRRSGALVPGSDGLPVRLVREWNNEKLSYVEKYVEMFSTAMKNKWPRRVYIDLFAGPGMSLIEDTGEEVPGSPMLAVEARTPFSDFFFNDAGRRESAALAQRLTHRQVHASVTQLDCNMAARDVASLFTGQPKTIGLAFIDPNGFKIGLDSIAEMTAGRTIDLIITVMTGYMKRYMREPGLAASMDRFFGFTDWRELISGEAHKAPIYGALLEKYKRSLRSLGYTHVNDTVRVPNTRGATIYHLVFASRHPLGGKFFEEVVKKQHSGQRRLAL